MLLKAPRVLPSKSKSKRRKVGNVEPPACSRARTPALWMCVAVSRCAWGLRPPLSLSLSRCPSAWFQTVKEVAAYCSTSSLHLAPLPSLVVVVDNRHRPPAPCARPHERTHGQAVLKCGGFDKTRWDFLLAMVRTHARTRTRNRTPYVPFLATHPRSAAWQCWHGVAARRVRHCIVVRGWLYNCSVLTCCNRNPALRTGVHIALPFLNVLRLSPSAPFTVTQRKRWCRSLTGTGRRSPAR